MDLTTRYLGFTLPHPLMPGASPLVDDLDTVRRLEDAGAAAIVMRSLFEEQAVSEELAIISALDYPSESFPEALSYLPTQESFRFGPDEYLEQIRKIKECVSVPVIASLNGITTGGWLDYAALIQDAGADALELNTFHLPTDPGESPDQVEQRVLDVLKTVKGSVRLPIAVKLSPFHSSLPHLVKRLEEAGAAGVVLFNRFYQPDIDVERLEVVRSLELSTPSELRLRLRWLAVLSPWAACSLGASGGIHSHFDAIKAVMCGAHAVQVVSALLQRGPGMLTAILDGMRTWLEEHDYESLEQMRGSMNLARCPDPRAHERANYVKILQTWELPVD